MAVKQKRKSRGQSRIARNRQPITETHTAKIAYWNFDKNSNAPENYTYGQAHIVNWICPDDPSHTWKQKISSFLRRQSDCLFCARKPVVAYSQLSVKFPELAKEWHPTKNNHLTPDSVAASTPSPAWWQCKAAKNHIYYMPVNSRTEDKVPCPFCSASKLKKNKSLAKLWPQIAQFLDSVRSYGLSASEVSPDSPVIVYFECPETINSEKPHTIRMSVKKATESNLDCVACRKKGASYSSLAVENPNLAAQWHKTKNGDLTPWKVKARSSRLVWWQCPKARDHEWRTAVTERKNAKEGCPFCSGKKQSSTKSFAVDNPDLLDEWHPKLNRGIDPFAIPSRYDLRVTWQCKVNKKHTWKAPVCNRVYLRTGCPHCANWSPAYEGKRSEEYKLSKEKSLAFLHPEVAARWHPKLNGNVTPWDVAAGSHKKAFFQCKLFPNHAWSARIGHHAVNCPKCKSYSYESKDSLEAHYPAIALDWHPTKNAPITPDCISPKTPKRFWWVCKTDAKHVWEAPVANRTAGGSGCPYCMNRIVIFDRSLAEVYPTIAAQWHEKKNGKLKPTEVSPKTGKQVWWRCDKGPDHEWEATVHNRVNRNSGCPCCVGRKFSVTTTIAYTHPEIAAQWHPTKNAQVKPDQVRKTDERSFWWQCAAIKKHIWKSRILQRIKGPNSCKFCADPQLN